MGGPGETESWADRDLGKNVENWLSFPLSHAVVLMLGVASYVARCAHPVSPGTSYTPGVASFCFLKTCFQEGKKYFIFSLYLWFLILFNS